MAASAGETGMNAWREWHEAVGGWALILFDSGCRLICERRCLHLGVGCICEGCSVRMEWNQAANNMFIAEMALRDQEEREKEEGESCDEYVRHCRWQRFVSVRRVWKTLLDKGVAVWR